MHPGSIGFLYVLLTEELGIPAGVQRPLFLLLSALMAVTRHVESSRVS